MRRAKSICRAPPGKEGPGGCDRIDPQDRIDRQRLRARARGRRDRDDAVVAFAVAALQTSRLLPSTTITEQDDAAAERARLDQSKVERAIERARSRSRSDAARRPVTTRDAATRCRRCPPPDQDEHSISLAPTRNGLGCRVIIWATARRSGVTA